MAPANGCKNPQARFCSAIDRVESDTEMPTSRVKGCRKMPRLWRRPMLSVSIKEAPIRIGSAGRNILKRGMVVLLPDLMCFQPRLDRQNGLITQVGVIRMKRDAAVKRRNTQVCVNVRHRKDRHEG